MQAKVDEEVNLLVPLLPKVIFDHMIGGEAVAEQVPSEARRCAMVGRMLRERAGTEGEQVARVRLMLGRVREYACVVLGKLADERDAACFLMSAGLAHKLVARENECATRVRKRIQER